MHAGWFLQLLLRQHASDLRAVSCSFCDAGMPATCFCAGCFRVICLSPHNMIATETFYMPRCIAAPRSSIWGLQLSNPHPPLLQGRFQGHSTMPRFSSAPRS